VLVALFAGRDRSNNNKIIIPWKTVLIEKLAVTQLITKFTTFYGTRRLIKGFARALC
jgi:hypothetical protein